MTEIKMKSWEWKGKNFHVITNDEHELVFEDAKITGYDIKVSPPDVVEVMPCTFTVIKAQPKTYYLPGIKLENPSHCEGCPFLNERANWCNSIGTWLCSDRSGSYIRHPSCPLKEEE